MKQVTQFLIVIIISIFTTFSATAQIDTEARKAFQFSFITPLGTNGINSSKVANNYSVNLLGGYSRATNVFEFGGLYNINRQYTKGFQFAGLTNFTGEGRNSVQVAGLSNIARKGRVGFQLGGILNVAKKVGTQVGLINIADSVGGASIGLINIVKKNGKQEFEVGLSDAVNTYASFKLGTDRLYTIFSTGINYLYGEETQYAVGLGFGTEIKLKNDYATQFELIGYGLTEGEQFTNDINLLTQFKVTASKEFGAGFKVFAGPVFNLTVSRYKDEENNLIGSNLAPYTLFESEEGNTNLKGWVGFTLGLRY